MKKIIIVAVCAFAILLGIVMAQNIHITRLNDRVGVSMANEKALNDRIAGAEHNMAVYQASLNQLKHSNDSITQELLKTKGRLKIKDKELLAMAGMSSSLEIHDTLRLHDTIFKEPAFRLDTIITDPWRRMEVGLEYPNVIEVGCQVRSQKEVFITKARETVDPPHRFFLCRWLQRKHDVIRVHVEEQNPYVLAEENVFIRIMD